MTPVRPSSPRRLPILLLPLFFLLASSCGQPEGELLRYRFSVGTGLDYDIGLRGGGLVRLITPSAEGGEDSHEFTLEIEGKLRLSLAVDSVTPEGVAEILVTYSGIRLSASDNHDGRNLKVIMTEEGIETWEGDVLINEVVPGDPEFFLGELSGRSFRMVMDSRGRVVELEEPSALLEAVPYVRFRELLLAAQPELPENRVKPGDAWERRLGLTLPSLADRYSPGETYEGLTRYTYLENGEREKLAPIRLGITSELVRSEAEKKPSALLGFSQGSSGEVVFDPEAGCLISSRLELEQELAVRIAIPQLAEEQGIRLETEIELEFEMNPGKKI